MGKFYPRGGLGQAGTFVSCRARSRVTWDTAHSRGGPALGEVLAMGSTLQGTKHSNPPRVWHLGMCTQNGECAWGGRTQLWAPGRPSSVGIPGDSTHPVHLGLLRESLAQSAPWLLPTPTPKRPFSIWGHHSVTLPPITCSLLMVPVLASISY